MTQLLLGTGLASVRHMSEAGQGGGNPAGADDELAAFTAADFELLEEMAAVGAEHSVDLPERVDALWAKAERLVGELMRTDEGLALLPEGWVGLWAAVTAARPVHEERA